MKTRAAQNRKLVTILACALLLVLLATLGLWLNKRVGGFADAMGCANRLIQQTDSPEGAHSVFKFERKCGATAPDTLQMSVQPYGLDFDNEKYPSFLVLDSRADAVPAWDEKGNLTVKLSVITKNYRNENESGGVRIIYVR